MYTYVAGAAVAVAAEIAAGAIWLYVAGGGMREAGRRSPVSSPLMHTALEQPKFGLCHTYMYCSHASSSYHLALTFTYPNSFQP